jgi:hypothetical protein
MYSEISLALVAEILSNERMHVCIVEYPSWGERFLYVEEMGNCAVSCKSGLFLFSLRKGLLQISGEKWGSAQS